MKSIVRHILPAVLVLFSSISVKAQDNIEALLLSGVGDANTIVEGYAEPFMNTFSTGLTGGWYSSAKTHKPFGMEILVTANAVFVPDGDLFYSPNFDNLDNITGFNDPSVTSAPTVFGPEEENLQYEYMVRIDNQDYAGSFDAPPGADIEENLPFRAVPVPMVQLGIGIYKNTDLKLRWTPTIDIDGDGQFKLLGVGIMHDIKQHIPAINKLPFDLSALVGFTDMSLEYDIQSAIDDIQSSGEGSLTAQNAKTSYDVNTWTVQGIIGKKFSVLSVYGGVGYNFVSTKLNMTGEYTVTYDNGTTQASETFVNPINFEFSQSGPRLTAGFRLKLAILTINADYTLQRNSMLTVGLGFSFREAKAVE